MLHHVWILQCWCCIVQARRTATAAQSLLLLPIYLISSAQYAKKRFTAFRFDRMWQCVAFFNLQAFLLCDLLVPWCCCTAAGAPLDWTG